MRLNLAVCIIIVSSAFLPRIQTGPATIWHGAVAQDRAPLPQILIDTSIQRAVYILNEAAAYSSVGNRHADAVARARHIANDLKRRAKGDANEKYVLWKVSELEYQIYLEEEEMRIIKQQKDLLSSNALVIEYNREVAKHRPCFSTLRGIFKRMSEVDTRQANNIADSYNRRYRNISREAIFSAEKALMSGDLELAGKEIEYLEKNRFFLVVRDSRLKQMREQYNSLVKAQSEIATIEQDLISAERDAADFRLNQSRNALQRVMGRLETHRSSMSAEEYETFSTRSGRLLNFLNHREDSLVKVTIKMIEHEGVEKAHRYFEDVLQKMGLSHERASFIDRSILSIRCPDEHGAHKDLLAEFYNISEQKSGLFDDMRTSAMKTAQHRADSIRAEEDEVYAMQRRDKLKTDSLQRINREKANDISMEIYTRLQRNRIRRARRLFNRRQDFLEKYLEVDFFTNLAHAVTDESPVTASERSSSSYAIEQTADSRQSRELTPASEYKRHKTSASDQDTRQFLPQSNPGGTAAESDEMLRENRERAHSVTIQIYSRLEKNQIKEAHDLFMRAKGPLKRYLNPEAYNMLETTVVQSYELLE